MRKKSFLLICLSLILLLAASGCSVLRFLDGSSETELAKFEAGDIPSPQEPPKRLPTGKAIKMLQSEQEAIKRNQEVLASNVQERTKSLSSDLVKVDRSVDSLTVKVDNMTNELQAKISKLETETAALQAASAPTSIAATGSKAGTTEVSAKMHMPMSRKGVTTTASGKSIKVLSGDGKLSSAKKLSDKLKADGYEISRIDVAPRNFSNRTVFYAAGFEDEARRLAKTYGFTRVLPLSWKSVFDLIIVTSEDTASK